MITYRRDEIINRHGQRIYNFAKQIGNTELEKCIKFIDAMNVIHTRYDVSTVDGRNIIIILTEGGFEVFNSVEEKIGECEIDYTPRNVTDMTDDLSDIGFDI